MSGTIARAAFVFVTVIVASPIWAAVGNSVDAVRTYDENLVQTNVVDVNATTFTVAQMTSYVALEFDNGRGGVIDFDNGLFTDPNTIDARFAGGNRSLRITNAARPWSIGTLGTNSSSGAISGGNVCFNGAPAPFPNPFLNDWVFGDVTDSNANIVPNHHVIAFGFTIIDGTQNSSGNNINMTANFSDGSSHSSRGTGITCTSGVPRHSTIRSPGFIMQRLGKAICR